MASELVERFERLESEEQFVMWLSEVLTDFYCGDGYNRNNELRCFMREEGLGSPAEALDIIHNRYSLDYDTEPFLKAVGIILHKNVGKGDIKVDKILNDLTGLLHKRANRAG